MQNPILQVIKAKYTSLEPVLDERARRLWAGAEARAIGRGGITPVAQATGLSRVTVRAGLKEFNLPITPAAGRETLRRLRRVGGGRKHLVDHDVDLLRNLEILVDPVTRGDPMSPLQWTCKSAAKLAAEIQARGHAVSERSVNRLLHALDYSLQSNRKTLEGKGHPDRDAQFQYINRRAKAFQRQGQPVVSVDAKKTAMGGTGRTGFQKQCTDDPYPAELAACSFVHVEAVGRQGPPLSTQGPRLAILKYQGSDPTQPYPTFVVRQSATLLYGFAPQRK